MKKEKILTGSREETLNLGEKIGNFLKPGTVIALYGNLGTGKTTFTKGLSKGIGVENQNAVKSPSFVILNEYAGKWPVYHIDLYRLEKDAEVDSLGLEDFVEGNGTAVIEWAEKIKKDLPPERLDINFDFTDEKENSREISLNAYGEFYANLLEKIEK